MTTIRVWTAMAAPVGVVWRHVEQLERHTSWMADAVAIRFVTDRRRGVGTAFDCDTRIGPFRTVDRMIVTEWVEPEVIGVRHEGVVSGTGRFTLVPAPRGRTIFAWEEELRFPPWLGGPLAALAARPVMRWLWRRNLAALAAEIAVVSAA